MYFTTRVTTGWIILRGNSYGDALALSESVYLAVIQSLADFALVDEKQLANYGLARKGSCDNSWSDGAEERWNTFSLELRNLKCRA